MADFLIIDRQPDMVYAIVTPDDVRIIIFP